MTTTLIGRARRSALEGMLASLAAVIMFYPLDTLKTRQQVALDSSSFVDAPSPNSKLINLVKSYYKGLPFKVAHTIISSFVFHFWLQCGKELLLLRKKRSRHGRHHQKLTVRENLLVTTLSAIVNLFFSLPFDTITTRLQIYPSSSSSSSSSSSTNLSEEVWFDPTLLYRGLQPAILLASNPAIHYTSFDFFKGLVVVGGGGAGEEKLTMLQAFFIGLLAKSTATLLTYPLIRAKVLLISREKQKQKQEDNNDSSLFQILSSMYESEGGFRSLFKGIGLQLSHTTLKAAFLMAVRELITV